MMDLATIRAMNNSAENLERDKNRPVIVHCIGLLVQQSTHCDDEDAIEAAWCVYDYFGKPETLPITSETAAQARKILRRRYTK